MIWGDVPTSVAGTGQGLSFVNQTSKGGLERGCLFVCVCVFVHRVNVCARMPVFCAHMAENP